MLYLPMRCSECNREIVVEIDTTARELKRRLIEAGELLRSHDYLSIEFETVARPIGAFKEVVLSGPVNGEVGVFDEAEGDFSVYVTLSKNSGVHVQGDGIGCLIPFPSAMFPAGIPFPRYVKEDEIGHACTDLHFDASPFPFPSLEAFIEGLPDTEAAVWLDVEQQVFYEKRYCRPSGDDADEW